MGDNGNVLSQAEIDALFKQAAGMSIARPPAAESGHPQTVLAPPTTSTNQATSQAKPAPVTESPPHLPDTSPFSYLHPPVAPDEALEEMRTVLNDLRRRISRLEDNIDQLYQKENTDQSAAFEKISNRLDALTSNIEKANARVDKIMTEAENTPGFNARREFQCSTCYSHGYLAQPIKCTKCGAEGWWGWWPKEK